MGFDDPVTQRIIGFLEAIGIRVETASLGADTFLPALSVRDGALVVDPDRLEWPGDLLHEAGHIALTEAAARPGLNRVSDDPGEEMAAIAWSYAAAVEIGLDPAIVFHEGGYRGGAQALLDNFGAGRNVGVPFLECYDMAADRRAGAEGVPPYPHMRRWLR